MEVRDIFQLRKDGKIEEAYAAIRGCTDFMPETAVVLGSGLGGYADSLKKIIDTIEL